ncbi:hypothetical protein [Alteromonas macleodii]|uniref:Uncharacterized protein n=1 Tax=Alteromonas macleodii TaxID=28108 RepID=A0AB36FRL8_ALTMA|nr:hypothetical protein [Alteromonas macleodii]OES24691.1 hypothetical protein BFV93_4708 [Alteromonas macleodii]OES25794.1 hypothetical protein BFV94_4320 [Alteromonas macleodii]OES25875.1 hypothetical protein BFV95_4263 [Alteromonas macleodii]OES38975.1 hypothetical protein BFV96_4469 [Alteromonas macleodii]
MSQPSVQPKDLLADGQLKQGIKTALVALLQARAFLETITPYYTEISQRAISKIEPVVEDNSLNRDTIPERIGAPIINVDDLYLANEETAAAIYADIKTHMHIKGFTPSKPENCAFLEARTLVREAEHLLIKAMEPYTGISTTMLYQPTQRTKYFELVLKCLVPLAKQTGVELNLYAGITKNQPQAS